jgi:hypothetical protein
MDLNEGAGWGMGLYGGQKKTSKDILEITGGNYGFLGNPMAQETGSYLPSSHCLKIIYFSWLPSVSDKNGE